MSVGSLPIGIAFLILGILHITQSTAKGLWMQRYLGTLQSFVLIVWLRGRFGAYGVRYYYRAIGIGSSIGGLFLIFSPTRNCIADYINRCYDACLHICQICTQLATSPDERQSEMISLNSIYHLKGNYHAAAR